MPDNTAIPRMTESHSLRTVGGTVQAGCALFEAAWSLGVVILMVLTPSLPENAILFGLSPARVAMSMFLLAVAGLSLVGFFLLRQRARQSSDRLTNPTREIGLWLGLAAILGGLMILVVYGTAAGAFPRQAIGRLAPFGAWLLVSGGVLCVALLAGMEGGRRRQAARFGAMLAIGLAGILVHTRVWPAGESGSSDIYYVYLEGQRLNRGENPYERVLAYELYQNEKFPHNLPLFYHLAAAVQRVGLDHFGPWIAAWRMVFLAANLVIALAIFHAYWRVGISALGAAGASLWLFNRWTLHVSQTGDIEFLALSFLVVSAVILADRPRASLVLFGISAAVRHLALGLAPIWLISAWRSAPSRRRKIADVLLMASVPVLTSLPLLVRSPNALFRSILNAWARPSEASGQVESLDSLLGIPGVLVSIVILASLAILYLFVSRRRLGVSAASMLALAAMISLSSVFFTSYMVWLIPFLPLAALETVPRLASAGATGATSQSG